MQPRLTEFQVDLSKFRKGQLDAFNVTTKRVIQDKESHTAIVLPTRYGKTDFMLMTGLYLMRQGAVSGVLIMAPNQVLRNQAIADHKLRESLARYKPARSVIRRMLPDGSTREGINPWNIMDPPRIERLMEHFPLAATTSMVWNNISVFQHWSDYSKHRYGSPPIVFVDEAHTTTDMTAWGGTIKALSEAGAYIVLCTATPYRTDGRPIPGFEVSTVYVDEKTKLEWVGERAYRLQGKRVIHKLTAHHVTEFKDAWAESVIAGLSRETFDVNLREHDLEGYSEERLSELPEREVRRALSRVVRSEVAVKNGVRMLVSNIRRWRKTWPGTAGIVFVGNDDGGDYDDAEANRYANMVKNAIDNEYDATKGEVRLEARIATTRVDGATQVIERFAAGDGDILIVKMMASAGLDIARLKIALDLSTVRTPVSFVQRAMRVCTRWELDGRVLLKALYIAPDECIGDELYERLIRDLGGDRPTVEWDTEGELVEGSESSPPSPLTEFEVVSTELGTSLKDEDGSVGPGVLGPVVDDFLDDVPRSIEEIGKGRLSQHFAEAARQAAEILGQGVPPEASQPTHPAKKDDGLLDNSQARINLKRKELVRSVKQYANSVMRREYGPGWKQGAYKDRYGLEINDAWLALYEKSGIRWVPGVKSGQMLKNLDEKSIDTLTATLKEMNNGGTH